MLKNYVMSFLAVQFFPLLMVPTVIVFVLFFFLSGRLGSLVKPCAGVLAVILAGVLLVYNYDKSRLKKKIRAIENVREYDNAVMLGNNFLCEERMLAYQNRDICEYRYEEIRTINITKGKKGEDVVVLGFPGAEVNLPVGSLSQAARTVAFLKRKNPSAVDGLETEGNGSLHSIDGTETAFPA